MFVLIVGGGKVGLNTARQLLQLGHEIVLIEQRKTRFDLVEEELGQECLVFGDGTEVWVLEKAGIGRADMVVAVTGDDEDNIIISQIAKLKFGVPKIVARVNNPFNQPTFDLLGIENTVCATTAMLRLIMHELPVHKFVHLLSLQARGPRARRARGQRELPVRRYLRAGHRPAPGRAAGGDRARGPRPGRARVHRDPPRRLRDVPRSRRARRRTSSRSSCPRRSRARRRSSRSSTPRLVRRGGECGRRRMRRPVRDGRGGQSPPVRGRLTAAGPRVAWGALFREPLSVAR